MTRAAIEQWLADHQAGFLGRNPEALAATHAPDGTFESPAHGLVHGREAIRAIYRYWYEAFPDFMLMWSTPIIEPPRAALFWRFDGTTTGPPPIRRILFNPGAPDPTAATTTPPRAAQRYVKGLASGST